MAQRRRKHASRSGLRLLPLLAIAAVFAGCGGDGGGGRAVPVAVAPEAPPTVRIAPSRVLESDEGMSEALFQVTLSSAPSDPVTVAWSTKDASALTGEDYEPGAGILVFDPAVIEDVIAVKVIGDSFDEPDEEFAVVLSHVVGATLESAEVMGVIEDDDDLPGLTIDGGTTSEGDGVMTFKVRLSPASRRTVRVQYATRNGSAVRARDYEEASGEILFSPGTQSRTVSIEIENDRDTEGDEDFFVVLSEPENATIEEREARAVIVRSDARPPPPPPAEEPPDEDKGGKKKDDKDLEDTDDDDD